MNRRFGSDSVATAWTDFVGCYGAKTGRCLGCFGAGMELVLGLIHRAVSEQKNQAIFEEKTELCLRCNGAGKIEAEMSWFGLV